MPSASPRTSLATRAGLQEIAGSRRSLVKGAAWTMPALLALPAARAYAASAQASGLLGSLCTGALDLTANTVEVSVSFGILIPAGATVHAGDVFTFAVSVDMGVAGPTPAPTALSINGLASGSFSGEGGSYTYQLVVEADYTNTSGGDQFYPGGLVWSGTGALPIDSTITTADSGTTEPLSSDGTCYYNSGY